MKNDKHKIGLIFKHKPSNSVDSLQLSESTLEINLYQSRAQMMKCKRFFSKVIAFYIMWCALCVRVRLSPPRAENWRIRVVGRLSTECRPRPSAECWQKNMNFLTGTNVFYNLSRVETMKCMYFLMLIYYLLSLCSPPVYLIFYTKEEFQPRADDIHLLLKSHVGK